MASPQSDAQPIASAKPTIPDRPKVSNHRLITRPRDPPPQPASTARPNDLDKSVNLIVLQKTRAASAPTEAPPKARPTGHPIPLPSNSTTPSNHPPQHHSKGPPINPSQRPLNSRPLNPAQRPTQQPIPKTPIKASTLTFSKSPALPLNRPPHRPMHDPQSIPAHHPQNPPRRLSTRPTPTPERPTPATRPNIPDRHPRSKR